MKTITVIIFLLLAACSSRSYMLTDNTTEEFPKTDPMDILVYSTDKVDKDYIIIGELIVNADAGTVAVRSVRRLKEEAARVGADAIINLRIEFSYGYWQGAIKSTGTAIKFK